MLACADDYSGNIPSEIMNILQPILIQHRQNIDLLIQPFGISAGQPPLMTLLMKKDGRSQKELVDLLNVKPASVTTMVCRMEKTGLVKRRKDDFDQRVTRVYLTEKGKKAGKKMMAVIRFVNKRNLAGFNDCEKQMLLRLLERIKANLDTEHEELVLIKSDKQ